MEGPAAALSLEERMTRMEQQMATLGARGNHGRPERAPQTEPCPGEPVAMGSTCPGCGRRAGRHGCPTQLRLKIQA